MPSSAICRKRTRSCVCTRRSIENGFVHVPDTVPWLAQYLHELFPNGRHEDQVDLDRTDAGLVQARRQPQLQCGNLRIVQTARRGASPRPSAGPSPPLRAPLDIAQVQLFAGLRCAVCADSDHPLVPPPPNAEDIDLGLIQTDLEFLIERVSRLPTRQEVVLRPLWVIAWSLGSTSLRPSCSDAFVFDQQHLDE
jgi:hypothetical protein